MTTKAPGVSDAEKQTLRAERDEQIRQTAVDTLHPAGLPSERLHPDADKAETVKHAAKDAKARDVFTSVLLLLQHGLKTYDPGRRWPRTSTIARATSCGRSPTAAGSTSASPPCARASRPSR